MCFRIRSIHVQRVFTFPQVHFHRKIVSAPAREFIWECGSTLGCDPYNLLSKQFEGRDIYVYKYKIVERKFSPRRIDWRGIGAETRGIERYNPSWEDAFLIFKDDKLESVVTTVGLSRRGSITLIRINNTLYEVSNKRGEYTIKLSDPKPEEIIVGRGLKKRRHKR